jgi:4-hydroxy-tetrahydrodipicolinate synthase
MSKPSQKRFRGKYTVMVTPFDAGGGVDEKALRRFVDFQVAGGAHGLIPLGSTGEFLSLSHQERERVARIVVEQAAGRIPVLVGTAAEWTDEAITLSRAAEKAGADGLMIIPPFYSSPTEDEIFNHFRRIAGAVSVPIMVYNNPFTSNVDLKPRFVARLSEIDQVAYIKESSGDVTRVDRILALCGDRMTVFAGYHPWESFLAGAQGYVSVFSNIAPGLSSELFTLTADRRDFAASRDLNRRVIPLLDALAGDLYVSATKAALEMIGQPMGNPRPPRLPLPEEKIAGLKAALSGLGLMPRG